MGVFEFVIILVIITTLGKVIMAVGAPLVDKIGDLAREMAASRRVEQGSGGSLPPEVVEELEKRLTRIEDRLDFLEELKAPDRNRALRPGAGGPGGSGRPRETGTSGIGDA